MPVTIRDRYKEIFQAHRFASEYRLKILTALFVLASMGYGCGSRKELTASNAKSMLQAFIDNGSDHGRYFVEYQDVSQLVGKIMFENFNDGNLWGESPKGAVAKLIAGGYISQTSDAFSLPDISGTYTGTWKA